MSNSIFPAFNGLTLQAESTQDISVEGVVSIRAIYTGSLNDINNAGILPGMPHPFYAYVGVQTLRIVTLKGGWGRLEVNFLGAYTLGLLFYSRQTSLTSIPVQQARNFSTIAGALGSEKNGSVFDATSGEFTGWKGDSPYNGFLNIDATKIVVTQTSVTASPTNGPTVNGQPTSCPGPFQVGASIFMGAANSQLGYVAYRNVLTWQNIPSAMIPPRNSGDYGDSSGDSSADNLFYYQPGDDGT